MDEADRKPVVPPPVPAPYLVGLAGLSDAAHRALKKKRPSPSERRLIRREQVACQRRIIAARLAYQNEHGVKIGPEPCAGPHEALKAHGRQ